MNINVTRKSQVKVLGRWVRVPNWMIREQWSPERIAREELRAQQLGDMQKFVMASPLFPTSVFLLGCVALWAALKLAGAFVTIVLG